MNQKDAMLGVLVTYLSEPAPLADHLDMLVAMLVTAGAEKRDVEDRHDVGVGVFREFAERCAAMWGCSYTVAVDRCEIEIMDRRQFYGSGDPLPKMPYDEYLQSRHWQGVRHYALLRADNRCQICNSTDRLEVHHRTYERRGAEDYRDVIALCHKCHSKFHNKE